MHQLRALVWKAYKVRLRSPLSTALDTLGPVVIILLYICLKLILGSLTGQQASQQLDAARNFSTKLAAELLKAENKTFPRANLYEPHIFRNPSAKPLNARQDLARHLCTKVLFAADTWQGDLEAAKRSIAEECGISELVSATSGDDLLHKLQLSLEKRIQFKPSKAVDLNRRSLKSSDGCFTLQAAGLNTNNSNSNSSSKEQAVYQAGIVLTAGVAPNFRVYLTDAVSDKFILQPFTQGSGSANEFKFPHSDLNAGLHLLTSCVSGALAKKPQVDTNSRQGSSSNSSSNSSSSSPTRELEWRLRAFPITASGLSVPSLFLIFFLVANFCNALATVLRVSEENESGLHQYIRKLGVSATTYWLSHTLTIFVHVAVQSLVLAILLAIPTSENILFDPIYEANITIRFLLLLSYAFSLNAHALFVGSLFSRVSHALLATSFLATSYAMYPITFMLRWNPYQTNSFGALVTALLLNPVSNFEALFVVLCSIYMQTSEPLSWSQLSMSIIGGGACDWSLGALWAFLLLQAFFWIFATILLDQLFFATSFGPFVLLGKLLRDTFCCCLSPCCCSNELTREDEATLTKSRPNSTNTLKSGKDPNRVCCSLRNVSVKGPIMMRAHTRGDPLKFTPEQLNEIKQATKASQYLINRGVSASWRRPSDPASLTDEPILLDEALQQHIIWNKSQLSYENLSLDFRFNQVSFLLGQTDAKELFFATLMGLKELNGGHIVLDGVKFGSVTLSSARPHIGYLSERNLFLNELSIFENLQFFGSLRDPNYNHYDSESSFLLDLLHLSRRKSSAPSVLTSRSARKLALAVAAVGHTKLLLLVEPTLGLHWRPRCQVLNLLKKYKSIRSIVVDTSDVDEATAFGDRVVLLKSGQAQLDGAPDRLRRKFACGHWIVFEPIINNELILKTAASSPANSRTQTQQRASIEENVKKLELLTSHLFKKDKLESLDPTTRSVYQELMKSSLGSHESVSKVKKKDPPSNSIQRTTVILKVKQSPTSNEALCKLIKLFQQHRIVHGFRLVEITYESLEDILVMRMSRAIYPDLPPDLLLSLQHRTLNQTISPHDQVSVRKYSVDTFQTPKVMKSVFGFRFSAILRERMADKSEVALYLISLLISLAIVATALICLRVSLSTSAVTSAPRQFKQLEVGEEGEEPRFELSLGLSTGLDDLVDTFYRQRIGLVVVGNTGSTNSTQNTSFVSYLEPWSGNKKLASVIRRDSKELDVGIVTSLMQKSRDLAASIIFYDPERNQATLVFEPQLPHAMIAAMRAFIKYYSSSRKRTLIEGIRLTPTMTVTGSSTTAMVNTNPKGGDKFPRIDQKDDDDFPRIARRVSRELKPTKTAWQRVDRAATLESNEPTFQVVWHEIVRGHLSRRMFYGLGFGLAEALTIGLLVSAPIRHRSESRVVKVRTIYWFAMALTDFGWAILQIFGYTIIIVIIEGTYSPALISSNLITLFFYKLASLPIPYLVSLVAKSSRNGFLFIVLVYATIAWVFSIHLRTFLQRTIFSGGYLYTISSWIILLAPISSLIDALVDINHISRIDKLCEKVPAYLTTSNIVELDGPQQVGVLDKLLDKVQECLTNGKSGISTNVLHQRELGILWKLYLIILFGIVAWIFLLFSERVFGLLARRLTSFQSSNDPLTSVVRSGQPTSSVFKWNREKDRLVSEYIRCMNEIKYVKQMASNCIYLRIWLRPLSDQSTIERRLIKIIEPLLELGQPKNEIQIELRTTLQLFIRIGSETNRYRTDRVQLIETYAKFVKDHEDTVVNFAVVNWTRETLYKILLHGHYNTKSTSSVS